MTNKKALMLTNGGGTTGVLYKRMQVAINECYSVDDCRKIAMQAGAVAAYYSQIKDDESVRKFLQIKLRAWRRIGEILMGAGVDRSTCETTAEYIRRIRAVFKSQKDIEELSDNSFRQALKVAEVSVEFFENNMDRYSSIDSIASAFAALKRRDWEATPEGQAELKAAALRRQVAIDEEAARQKKVQEKKVQQKSIELAEAVDLADLVAERDRAFDEVGITLDRRDREQMHQIVFLLKRSIHEILRQAAFDNRMTMQAILRSGLMMWFIAHGYTVSSDDMQLPRRDQRRRTSPSHQ